VRGTNEAQQKLLLQEGLGQTFWNLLSVTGEIEGRGRVLADLQLPGFADAVVEPIASLAIGHLNAGLLEAHGFDEGGDPRSDAGGHDAMWFALRDLAFGEVEFPPAVAPARIGRPDEEARLVPEIPARIEGTIAFLMNLLLIEFRAALNFDFTEACCATPSCFANAASRPNSPPTSSIGSASTRRFTSSRCGSISASCALRRSARQAEPRSPAARSSIASGPASSTGGRYCSRRWPPRSSARCCANASRNTRKAAASGSDS
jgi:hypothetical protein